MIIESYLNLKILTWRINYFNHFKTIIITVIIAVVLFLINLAFGIYLYIENKTFSSCHSMAIMVNWNAVIINKKTIFLVFLIYLVFKIKGPPIYTLNNSNHICFCI